jgi:acyl-CoA synthetase (AMP-forming)/AMP-acid ligase II
VQVLDDDGKPVTGRRHRRDLRARPRRVRRLLARARADGQAALDANGWLRTGDLARVDDEGYIYIVDRKKEMLVSGGFNVYPSEMESVLAQHPASTRCAWSACPTTTGARP